MTGTSNDKERTRRSVLHVDSGLVEAGPPYTPSGVSPIGWTALRQAVSPAAFSKETNPAVRRHTLTAAEVALARAPKRKRRKFLIFNI